MKTLSNFINESLNKSLISNKTKNKIKNIITKILSPFSKTYDLPYICIHNGNCFAPGFSIKENNDDINKFINKCVDYLKDNYYDKITKEKKEELKLDELNGDTKDAFIFELADCDDDEAAEIYAKVVNFFIKEAKTLPNIYGPKQLRHDNYESDAYVDNYSVELDIHSENMDGYIYPSIELVTHTSIKK